MRDQVTGMITRCRGVRSRMSKSIPIVKIVVGKGAHVLAHMIDARGGRNGAGHRRMRDDEFEEELCPVGAVELPRPGGKRMVLEQVEQLLAAERTVNDHAEAAVSGQRQETLFGLAVEDVVGELHEVERHAPHHPFDFILAAAMRGRSR